MGTMTGTSLFSEMLINDEQFTNNNIYAYEQNNEPQAKGNPCN